ncbi:glycosyltransferase family protein [Microbacterium profundi]|uniref:glycosyltransferase family protein n=1 Tax=Microbacterium profundi TaxID=450380 RepID=UPI0006912B6C|nr:glycosyltransferase family 1 protein [Microbacterium profundi]
MLADFRDRTYAVLVRMLPASVAGHVLPGLIRQFRDTGVTSVRSAPRRLLIAPVNSAGQGYAWARSAERIGDVAAANYMFRGADDVFGFVADHVIPATALLSNERWRRAQRDAIFKNFTHMIIESGIHLVESNGELLPLIRELQQHGVRVALLWHGSDIRLPSAHARREPDSPFGNGYPDTEILEQIASRNKAVVDEAAVAVFVSTPDLLADVPQANWLPVVVEPSTWEASSPALERERPVVLHVPSRAGLKGTALIEATMARLHEEGVIEYREVHGVPVAQMPQLYAGADIVLDQFLAGSYGVAACEALAAGRVVIGHVADEVRRTVQELTGHDVPIVQARTTTLEASLRRIVADREEARAMARRGPEFVRSVHDGRTSAEVLRPFLDS